MFLCNSSQVFFHRNIEKDRTKAYICTERVTTLKCTIVLCLQVREYSVWLTRQIDPLTLLTFYLVGLEDSSADFANILPS
jgi:hypothetical protein